MSLPFSVENRPTRQLTHREEKLIDGMYADKMRPCLGYVTIVSPVPMGRSHPDKSPWEAPAKIIQPRATLRIVMISRFGDFGLTDDLDAELGYDVRLNFDDAAMTDIRLTREPTP
jgi:hypothetical protein